MAPARKGELGESVAPRVGLMGEEVGSDFTKIKDRLEGVIEPTTIWTFNPPRSNVQEALREYVGDDGSSRAESFMGGKFLPAAPGVEASDKASVFNPELAAWIIKAYSNPGDIVIDPFAGGGTRGIIAGTLDRQYVGVDIRTDEVERVQARVATLGLEDEVKVYAADSCSYRWPTRGDLLLTCPPYWNLEVYSDDPSDLSTCPTYGEFVHQLGKVILASRYGVVDGGFIVWVVGDFRHPKTGELIHMAADVIRLHQKAGAWLYDMAVYDVNNTQATRRVGQFDKTRKLVRVHEHVLIFRVGGRGQA
jgi:tRNA1(Val) A37 N6-methylase TrmN6